MYDETDLARAVCDNDLELVCPTMELLICPHYSTVALAGSGIIRSDGPGRIGFRLVGSIRTHTKDVFRTEQPVGQLLDASEHLMLRAIDQSGMEWRSNWFTLSFGIPGGSGNWDVGTHLSSIQSTSKYTDTVPPHIQLHFPRAPRVPMTEATVVHKTVKGVQSPSGWSLDRHFGTLGSCKCEIEQVSGQGFCILARASPETILSLWPGCFCHAIEMLTQKWCQPVVIVSQSTERRNVAVNSISLSQPISRMPIPLPIGHPDYSAEFWQFAGCIIDYLERKGIKAERVVKELEGIRRGAFGSFSTACLTLAVGLESLSRMLLDVPVASQATAEELRQLLDAVTNSGVNQSLQQRASSQIGQLNNVRAVDVLWEWAGKDAHRRRLVHFWKKLRNPVAHGSEVVEDQQNTNAYHACVELLYRLLADATGYSGRLLDTQKPGWGFEAD